MLFMTALRDFKARLRVAAVPIFIALIGSYFAFHVVQGEHGVISYIKLRTQISEAKQLSDGISEEERGNEPLHKQPESDGLYPRYWLCGMN
jgi:cell division protein FtsB